MAAPHSPVPVQMAPVVHRGGTSKQELERQLAAAADTLATAVDTLAAAGPNGRDYPRGGLPLAIEQHQSRLDRLVAVLDELQALQIAVCDQQ